MTQHKLDPLVAWIRTQDYDTMLPQVEEIARKNGRRGLSADDIKKLIDGSSRNHLMLALEGKQVLGFVLYRSGDGLLTIEHLEEDPQYKGQGVREKVLAVMAAKLDESKMLTKLEYAANMDDTDLLIYMRDQLKFSVRKGAPLIEGKYPRGAKAVMMEVDIAPKAPASALMVYDPALARQQEETEEERPVAPPMRGALLLAMKDKLGELTGMRWEIVKADEAGVFQPVEVSRFEKSGKGMHFRTVDLVAEPAKAMAALRDYLGLAKEKVPATATRRAAMVDFPAEWVRSIHVEHGRKGQLEASFERVLILPHSERKRGDGGEWLTK